MDEIERFQKEQCNEKCQRWSECRKFGKQIGTTSFWERPPQENVYKCILNYLLVRARR